MKCYQYLLLSLAIYPGNLVFGFEENLVVPWDYPTIQAAVDASENYDFIWISPGTYTGDGNRDVNIDGKHLTISLYGISGEVVIDVQGSIDDPHRAFDIQGYGWAIVNLSNLTIRGGYMDFFNAPGGAGVHGDGVELIVDNCIFEDNIAYDRGGGLYISETGALFCLNTVFYNNSTAESGPGGGGLFAYSATVDNCIFDSNVSQSGGGAYFRDTVSVSNSTFVNNVSNSSGGGLGIGGSANLSTSVFDNNISGTLGGGLAASDSNLFNIDRCIFLNNRAIDNASCDFWAVKNLRIKNSLFTGNRASNCCGGIMFYGYFAELTNNTFSDNVGENYCGAIMLLGSIETLISNTIIWGNTSGDGNELSLLSLLPPVLPTNAMIDFCVIPADSIFIENEECHLEFGTEMIYSNPYFYDSESEDYQLCYKSPCIDNGTSENATHKDLTGEARRIGFNVDIGAYEYQTALPAGAHLFMDDTEIMKGENLVLDFLAISIEKEKAVELIIALEVYDVFYFFPNWDQTLYFQTMHLQYGRDWMSIFEFVWPEVAGSASGLSFWGAILDPGNHSVIGDVAQIVWSYY